ncbi:hypothetical protein IMSAG025_02269 [Muribaculaceae bacterium]|nr:hypothetical protein IMSAG025_02269 [Muribaculaceae bacterium]
MNVSWVMMMNMGISAVIALFLPIVLLVVWKVKNRGIRMIPFLVGAGVFIIFALFLEQICHYFVLSRVSPLSEYVNGHIWAFVLYGALAAGVFEETGRFLAFKTVLRRSKGKETAITYGIGHGGIESILVVGISMISSLILVVAINAMGGVENYVALVPAEAQGVLRENLNTLLLTPAHTFLLAGIERISTIIFHIALSVIVFFAVRGEVYQNLMHLYFVS